MLLHNLGTKRCTSIAELHQIIDWWIVTCTALRIIHRDREWHSSAMQRAKPVLAWQHFDLGELAIIFNLSLALMCLV